MNRSRRPLSARTTDRSHLQLVIEDAERAIAAFDERIGTGTPPSPPPRVGRLEHHQDFGALGRVVLHYMDDRYDGYILSAPDFGAPGDNPEIEADYLHLVAKIRMAVEARRAQVARVAERDG